MRKIQLNAYFSTRDNISGNYSQNLRIRPLLKNKNKKIMVLSAALCVCVCGFWVSIKYSTPNGITLDCYILYQFQFRRRSVQLTSPQIGYIFTGLFRFGIKMFKISIAIRTYIKDINWVCKLLFFFVNLTLVLSLPSTPEPLKMKCKMYFDV